MGGEDLEVQLKKRKYFKLHQNRKLFIKLLICPHIQEAHWATTYDASLEHKIATRSWISPCKDFCNIFDNMTLLLNIEE